MLEAESRITLFRYLDRVACPQPCLSLPRLPCHALERLEAAMKCFALFLLTIIGLLAVSNAAQAKWVRYYHRPTFVVAPQPVVRVAPAPVVVYQPTTVVTTRHRPILGGTVTHVRRGTNGQSCGSGIAGTLTNTNSGRSSGERASSS